MEAGDPADAVAGIVAPRDHAHVDRESLLDRPGERSVDLRDVSELDPDELGVERLLDQPCDAEPRDPEAAADLDLAQLAVEEEAGNLPCCGRPDFAPPRPHR